MIKQQTTTPVLRGGNITDKSFTIKASSAAFDILSSGLYSDKILAIVRELSCNAYDAHVSAGKKDIPFEIKLPNDIDPTFYVKDFGIGLSHEDVFSLYTTYFDSTKDNSNDFVGMLGLGSKSPFSYVSNFIVESRINGVVSFYSCFKNEKGLPAIALLSTSDTTEENGLTVKLTANRADFTKFETAAKTALTYFDPYPIVLGRQDTFKPPKITHSMVGSNWKLRSSDIGYRGLRIIQGFVSYPVDVSVIRQQELSTIAIALLEASIDCYVNIGDVDIAASRETLSYTPATIRNLVTIIEQLAIDMHKNLQQQFDQCPSEWAAGVLFDTFVSQTNVSERIHNLVIIYHKHTPFVWKNNPINRHIIIDSNYLTDTQLMVFTDYRRKLNLQYHVKSSATRTPQLPCTYFSTVLVDQHSRAREEYRRLYLSHPTPKKLLVIRQRHKNQEELDYVLSMIDNPKVIYVEPRPRKQVIRKNVNKRTNEQKLRWNGFSSELRRKKFQAKCWIADTVDLNNGGIYVPIHRYSVMLDGESNTAIDSIIAHATKLNIIPKDAPVYGFNNKDLQQIKKHSNWKCLFDVVTSHLTNPDVVSLYTNGLYLTEFQTHHTHIIPLLTSLLRDWATYELIIDSSEFKKTVIDYDVVTKQTKQLPISSIRYLIDLFNLNNTYTRTGTLLEEWKMIYERYPLLSYMGWSNIHPDKISETINYINLVDKHERLTDNINKLT